MADAGEIRRAPPWPPYLGRSRPAAGRTPRRAAPARDSVTRAPDGVRSTSLIGAAAKAAAMAGIIGKAIAPSGSRRWPMFGQMPPAGVVNGAEAAHGSGADRLRGSPDPRSADPCRHSRPSRCNAAARNERPDIVHHQAADRRVRLGGQHHADQPAHGGADPIHLLGAETAISTVMIGAVLRQCRSRPDRCSHSLCPAPHHIGADDTALGRQRAPPAGRSRGRCGSAHGRRRPAGDDRWAGPSRHRPCDESRTAESPLIEPGAGRHAQERTHGVHGHSDGAHATGSPSEISPPACLLHIPCPDLSFACALPDALPR